MSVWYKVTYIDMPDSEFEELQEVVVRKASKEERDGFYLDYGMVHVHELTYGLGLEYLGGVNADGEFEMIPSVDVVEIVKVGE